MSFDPQTLLSKHRIISDQVDHNELAVIMRELLTCLTNNIRGEVVEMGCYTGTTSLFLRRILNELGSKKELHVYDSFEGLPDKSLQDSSPIGSQFQPGALSATKKELIRNFQRANLQPPIVHKAWFSDLKLEDMPEKICFAFLDGDFYESIRDSLKLISPRLSDDAIIIVDDYTSESLPGAKRAVDEWFRDRVLAYKLELDLITIKWHA